MKIALIHSHLSSRGGSQRYVIEIANNLQNLGIEVDVYCYEYNKNACYLELTSGLSVSKVYTREVVKNNAIQQSKQNLIKNILKKAYGNNFVKNLVNTFGIDYLYSIYSTQQKAKKVSDIIFNSKNNYDLIFAHEEPLSVYAAIKYKKISSIPIYWFCYDTIEKWFLEWKDKHKNSLIRKILLKNIYFKYDKFIINKYVDKTAVLDNNMLRRYQELYHKTPLIRRGGISEEIFQNERKNVIRERYSLPNDTMIIFILTRFVNYRRVHDIFDMYEKLSNEIQDKVFIYLNSPITDQNYYDWCTAKYKNILSLKNIVIDLDYPRNDDEMYKMYQSSNIFIFPNENQTWGHAPLEAMGSGVATFVSNGCGISEVISQITPETIFEVGDTTELAQKIERVITDKTYEEISSKQISYVKKNLTWKKICEVYVDDFKEMIL